MIYEFSLSDNLGLAQAIIPNQKVGTFSDQIALTQSIFNQRLYVSHNLNLAQNISYHFGIKKLSVQSVLNIQSLPQASHDEYINDYLSLSSVVAIYDYPVYIINQHVFLRSSIQYHISQHVKTIDHEINLTQYLSYESKICDTPNTGFVTLTFNSGSLTLPAPQLGNKDSAIFSRILKRNRGNELVIFSDPRWPVSQKVNYTFETLTELQAKTLQNYVRESYGTMATLLDFEGKESSGIIINSDLPISQQGRGCNFKCELVLETYP